MQKSTWHQKAKNFSQKKTENNIEFQWNDLELHSKTRGCQKSSTIELPLQWYIFLCGLWAPDCLFATADCQPADCTQQQECFTSEWRFTQNLLLRVLLKVFLQKFSRNLLRWPMSNEFKNLIINKIFFKDEF